MSDNSEMISVAGEQAGNIGTDSSHRIAILGLHRGIGSIAGGEAILEVDHRSRSTRIH